MKLDVTISKRFPTFVTDKLGVPACASTDPEAFFPDRGEERWIINTAKKICSTCVYNTICKEWAIENREIGIWGGTTELDRKRIRKTRKAIKDSKMI